MRRFGAVAAAVSMLPVFALLQCLRPTEVTLLLATDVPCASFQGVNITVGSRGDYETKAPATSASACSRDGQIGSLVLVPSGSNDEEVAIRVVAGTTQTADDCQPPGYGSGCIVARRILRYLPHTPLTLPVELRQACAGIVCPADQTCVDGQCKSAIIPDPEPCASASGCPEGTLPDAGGIVAMQSCAPGGPGMTDCSGGSESCCTSLEVAGGTYYRTYQNVGSGPTGEMDQATVSGFRLDKYEVTVGRFRRFVAAYDAGMWTNAVTTGSGKHAHLNGGRGLANSGHPGNYESGWNASDDGNVSPTTSNLQCDPSYATWTASVGNDENLPIDCVDWFEAYAFCIWDGGFLPSEAEWEYAGAGGSQLREYPWGSAAIGSACPGSGCSYAIYDCYYPDGSGTCSGLKNIANVGTATQGAALYGQLDLAGNVWEWNLDWYATYVNPCTDCAYLTAASARVEHGGDFGEVPESQWAYGRNFAAPTVRSFLTAMTGRVGHNGFRCARTP